MIETYKETKKSDFLKSLKIYHNLYRPRFKDKYSIEKLRWDYGLELQSHKTNKYMQKKWITFTPSALYCQEQNGISEWIGITMMDMTKATILERNIDDNLWPKLVLAIT